MNRDEGFSVVPKWNEEASSLDSFEEMVKLYLVGTKEVDRHLCGPKVLAQMDPEKVIWAKITNVQFTGKGGAYLVVPAAMGMKPIQEAVRLFRQLTGLGSLRRQSRESMRKWASRFEGFCQTNRHFHQDDANIDADTFFHPLILGIMLLECSQLTPAENAAVQATPG